MPLTPDLQIQFDDCKCCTVAPIRRITESSALYSGTSNVVHIPTMRMLMEVQQQEVPLNLDINKYIDI